MGEAPYSTRLLGGMEGATSVDSPWLYGAMVRQDTNLGGMVNRLWNDSDIMLTGNDPLVTGVGSWAAEATGIVRSIWHGGSYLDIADKIEEDVADTYGNFLVDTFGYEKASGDYAGPVPDLGNEDRQAIFLERLNREVTVEGRQAILRMVRQEQVDREIISRAGVGSLLFNGLLTIPFDEAFWMELWTVRRLMRSDRVQRMARKHQIISAAALGSIGAGVFGGIREAVLYEGQYSRTPEEVVSNIKAEAMFGGVLSTAIATFGYGYRAALRKRFGAETVPDAMIEASDTMVENVRNNPGLRQRMSTLFEAIAADPDVMPTGANKVLDDMLDGVNQNVIELLRLREGTFASKIFNFVAMATPNMRFATSPFKSIRQIADIFTDTAMVKEGGGDGGISLERLKVLLDTAQEVNRMEVRDLFDKSLEEGSNFSIHKDSGVVPEGLQSMDKRYADFDMAVENIYRNDTGSSLSIPDIIEIDDPITGQRVNLFGQQEPLNARAKQSLTEAVQKFKEEQDLFDMISMQTGQLGYSNMKSIRAEYRRLHGENFVHRIIDRKSVDADHGLDVSPEAPVNAQKGAVRAVLNGMEDLRSKLQPEYEIQLNANQVESDNLKLLRKEMKQELRALRRQGVAGNEQKIKDLEKAIKESSKRIKESTDFVKHFEKKIEDLKPNVARARGVVENYRSSPDGLLRKTNEDMQRTVMIADKYLKGYLIESAEAQRMAFFNMNGMRAVAMQRLASSETRVFMKEARDLEVRLTELAEELATDPRANPARIRREIADTAQRLDIHANAARIAADLRLANIPNGMLKDLLGELQTATEKMLDVSDVGQLSGDALRQRRDEFKELREEFNKIADKAASFGIGDRSKAAGHISALKHLDNFIGRESPYNSPDYPARVKAELDRNPDTYVMEDIIDRALANSSSVRANLVDIETGMGGRNYRIEATMEREIIEKESQGINVKRLRKKMQSHIDSLQVMLGRYYETPVGQGTVYEELGPLLRRYNYMTSMGSVVFSSVPDMAMGLATAGFGPYVQTLVRYTYQSLKMAMKDMDPDARFYEMDRQFAMEAHATTNRIQQLMYINNGGADGIQQFSRRERAAMEKLWEGVQKVTATGTHATTRFGLLAGWNGFFKAVNQGAAASRIGRCADKLATGRGLSASDKQFLRTLKLTDADVEDMAVCYSHFGTSESNGIGSRYYYAKSQTWEGPAGNLSAERVDDLRRKVVAAMSVNADLSILTPGLGNLPGLADDRGKWAPGPIGGLALQFQRYFFIATENLMVPMFQRLGEGAMVGQATQAAAGLMMLGAAVEVSKATLRGEDPYPNLLGGDNYNTKEQWWSELGRLMMNAFDRSGMGGFLGELALPFVGDELGLSRSKQKYGGNFANKFGDLLLGATGNRLADIYHFSTGITSEEPMKPHQVRSGRRLLPFQNLLPLTMIADHGFSQYEAHRKAERLSTEDISRNPAEFYFDQFMYIEHRVAQYFNENFPEDSPLHLNVDYSKYKE